MRKALRSLNTRLVISHLAVSLVSIVLMAFFAGRSIFQEAIAEAEHNLQALAFAVGNALELPIEELRQGVIDRQAIKEVLTTIFEDSPEITFSVFYTNGAPMIDSSDTLPPTADRFNAPEVIQALETDVGRGMDIRANDQGEETLYVAVLIQREIEVTGILRLGLPLAQTMQDARRSLLILLLTAFLITSGVGLFGWMLASNLARPILVLTQAAEHMERGDLGVRVKPAGPYEMRRLSEAFNSMARRLQSNVNELRAFVANASHELRTPLTVVKLRTEALSDGALEEPEVAERFLSEIETEVDRLVRMVNDLLDLSRMEAGLEGDQRAKLQLGTIANEVYETFKIRAAKADVDLHLDIEPGLASVEGNEDQLRRLLYNLVENAIKFTPRGGRIDLLLRPGPKDNTVRALVRDNGPGIAPEHLPHVFERFYRAEQQSPPGTVRGSGLGLAIAKSIVESHGGEIGVSSQVDTGTTFWADLPSLNN
jgi:signal transduction histidine kinase